MPGSDVAAALKTRREERPLQSRRAIRAITG
jgi:hypothetical protein